MAASVIVPEDLWEEDIEAVVTLWIAADGGGVNGGDLIAEIMVQKVQHEINAPASGVLKILLKVDEIAKKGDEIGRIE